MKVVAWQIGNRVRVIADHRTGTIVDVGLVDGVFKYHVVSDTRDSWNEWFTGWEIKHA